eukprot:COSAG01_NODE_19626_length_999_cov_7.805556_1_plen_187_part_00
MADAAADMSAADVPATAGHDADLAALLAAGKRCKVCAPAVPRDGVRGGRIPACERAGIGLLTQVGDRIELRLYSKKLDDDRYTYLGHTHTRSHAIWLAGRQPGSLSDHPRGRTRRNKSKHLRLSWANPHGLADSLLGAPAPYPGSTLQKMRGCAGLSKILLILGRLRRLLPGPKSDSVENPLPSLF